MYKRLERILGFDLLKRIQKAINVFMMGIILFLTGMTGYIVLEVNIVTKV